MEEKRSIEVTVAGHRLPIKTAASMAEVQAAACLVEEKLEEIVSNKAMLSNQVLLLVALVMADELLKARRGNEEFQDSVRNKSEEILAELDQNFGLEP